MRLRSCFPHWPSSVPTLRCWNDLWFWMWPILPPTCLYVAPNEWRSFLLCSCVTWTPCPPVILNDWGAQGWGDGKEGTLNLMQKHHSVGTLFRWCGGTESKSHPGHCTQGEVELPFESAMSVNAARLPKAIPALIFLTRAVAPSGVVIGWWNRNPPVDSLILITKPFAQPLLHRPSSRS